MSCDQNESGTIKIPTAAWATLKKTVQDGVSALMTKDYELALRLYEVLAAAKKGKRNFDLKEALTAELNTIIHSASRWNSDTYKYKFHLHAYYELKKILLGTDPVAALRKPQKKDFPLCTTKSLSFSADAGSITFENETKTVRWHVSENNHSVDDAHQTAVAKLFFGALGKIKWTRATGGTICGNDEYNRDNEGEGGGGNYVTFRFGPLGEPEKPYRPIKRKATAARKSA